LGIYSKIKFKVISLIQKFTFSPLKYWEERAKKYGELSVLNVSLSADEIASVKSFQIDTIFPLLKKELNSNEKNLLDFGCGPGRLSVELATLTMCDVIAADPTEHLLQLGPKHPRVQYQRIENSTILAQDNSFDIIWIFCVMGGIISKKELNKAVNEISRVANENCLLFLIENTTIKKDIVSWKYRSIHYYLTLFKNFGLVHLSDFDHANERFSIFSGRYKKTAIRN
jgi:ubiquinone/menaquinone biosynthesis C-methylase UbiE